MPKRCDIPRSGLVSTRNWIRTPNGDQHNAFFCKEWLFQTDKDMDMVGVKTTDRWAMVALDGDKVLAIIPGCEVLSYMVCDQSPTINCYVFRGDHEPD